MNAKTLNALALSAALAGVMGGTTARLNAQTPTGATQVAVMAGSMMAVGAPLPKHACKGQNDCKGQGGGKHPGKNSCKGKGDCATDGSKPMGK